MSPKGEPEIGVPEGEMHDSTQNDPNELGVLECMSRFGVMVIGLRSFGSEINDI